MVTVIRLVQHLAGLIHLFACLLQQVAELLILHFSSAQHLPHFRGFAVDGQGAKAHRQRIKQRCHRGGTGQQNALLLQLLRQSAATAQNLRIQPLGGQIQHRKGCGLRSRNVLTHQLGLVTHPLLQRLLGAFHALSIPSLSRCGQACIILHRKFGINGQPGVPAAVRCRDPHRKLYATVILGIGGHIGVIHTRHRLV